MSIHKEKHFHGSLALRDIVIGMSDGLTVPFALAAGLSGASLSNSIIITAGISELVAGAISMGLGGYLAGKSEIEHYDSELRRETKEIETIPQDEKKEIHQILEKFGISSKTRASFIDELSADKSKWLAFMMEFELQLEMPDKRQALLGALRIGMSYGIGGLIPLSAYFFTANSLNGLKVSALLTILALGLFGYFKSKFLDQPKLAGAFRFILVGTIASSVAFFFAKLLGG